MNSKELSGMELIDKNAKDVAKIAEISFDTKTYGITKIIASTGNPISKKFYEIDPKNILALGDYLLIDTTVEELSQNKLDKIPESTGTNIKINESVGKTVIDADGNVAGKIANIDINFDNLEVENVTLAKSSSFGKPKDIYTLSKEDIERFGDYVITNKKIPNSEKVDEESEKTEEKTVDIE
ncbi:PRC-barrel domain-containing protein [Methanosphaera stadtmanae]|uniref:PRC-barrel domain-containing protein n=1 Tax=Methanosphaera stadtmanae TaxID=2317 RepID=UPI00267659FF|nr:PRC-barrel domain-containing protein [Methanosphaera stadtmanae]